MQKHEAQNIIESTFNASFSEEKFTLFIKNLLNDIDTTRYNEYRGNLIKDAYKDHIRQYKRIGKYTDPNGDALDVLIVEVKDQTKLDKTRTSLRNFVISHLDSFEKDYALVAFYSNSDHGADWRFSFVKLEYKTEVKEGKLKQNKELTPAKRYSFLVGVHEKAHTAKKQLLPLLENVYNNPTLEELEEAFSIEKVTDEFFEQYKSLFLILTEQFNKDKNGLKEQLAAAGIDIPRFTKKLLGQIVFLYFLQKKGWLGVPKAEKWGKGEKKYLQKLYDDAEETGKNFFGDYLQHLFYEALAHKHSDEGIKGYYKKLGCKVPFLNGGLFEADYDWQSSRITIPNYLFRNDEKVNKTGDVGTGVLDVFDRYNFTIKEDEPLEKEVAVDPEMLGKVFENMLDVTLRKSQGAFYTPREIVHYMCQESLIHYLDNAVNTYTKTYQELGNAQTNLFGNTGKNGQQSLMQEQNQIIIPKDDIEVYIRKGFFALENDQRVLREGKETKTYKFQLPESVRLNADLLDEKLTDIKICDPAIGSGAFPVGLLHELVNAQLVLKQYLSDKYLNKKLKALEITKADIEENSDKYNYRVKRHTIQESIYGVDIDASAIDIARLRLWLSLVVDEEDLDNIEALPNLDYKIVCGNSLIGLPENAMRNLEVEKELETLKEEFFAETDEAHKKELRTKINTKIRQLLDTAEEFAGYKIDFDFKLFFSEVWHYKGGFDVVIGNPPYGAKLSQSDKYILKDIYSLKSSETAILFIELSFRLLGNTGTQTYIIPKPLTYSSNYTNTRNFIERYLIEIVDCGKAFANVKFETIIIVNNKSNKLGDSYKNKLFTKFHDFQYLSTIKKNTKSVFGFFLNGVKDNEIDLAKKVLATSKYLGDYSSNRRGGMFQNDIEQKGNIPVFGGKEITRWGFKQPKGYVNNTTNIEANALLHKNSILVQNIVAHITNPIDQIKIIACLPRTSDNVLILDTINQLTCTHDNISPEILWILLKSSFLNWYSYRFIFGKAIRTMHFDNTVTNKIPLSNRLLSLITVEKNNIKTIVDYILFIQSRNNLLYSYFDDLIDSIVFELYFPTEIKSAGKEILKHLGNLPAGQAGLKPIDDSMSDEEKLAIIQSEFERLYDPNHQVRNNVETLDSVEEVRIIKEALK
ncbi:MAG: hypothetical protein K9H26_08065 [Prolixibacteraceae bacterium]|nr:hypothetical protein [Prolixibacteraceae bacterium]